MIKVIKMSFSEETRNTILAAELENLQRRENEMFKFYNDLIKDVKDAKIKDSINFIKLQEQGHIKMATTMISILQEYISKG